MAPTRPAPDGFDAIPTTGRSARPRLVIADADGTLLRINSLFSLLRFDARSRNIRERGETFLADLRAHRERGAPREFTNRRYFTWWQDREVDEVANLALDWSSSALGPRSFFHPGVIAHVARHVAAGRDLVVLSASFRPALEPIVRRFPQAEVICTQPTVRDGLYTGEVELPLVGEAKRQAVCDLLRRRNADLADSIGYGDHHSDAPFMALLGSRVVIGTRFDDISWAQRELGSFELLDPGGSE